MLKREYFEDFINNLFLIELEIIHNNDPKLHSSEQELFDDIYSQIANIGKYTEDLKLDKRIKNRLKNKIINYLKNKDILLLDKELRSDLSTEITFYNFNDFKKNLRTIIKRETNISNIHTFLLAFDELRTFFFKIKEQNEIKQYFELLEESLPLIDYNLGASYFLRELDLDLSKKEALSLVENKVRKIEMMIENSSLIDGYKFKLSKILCQHKINTGEWGDATKIALNIESDFKKGKCYSRENITKLYALFVQIYNQTYNESKYKFYLKVLNKSESDSSYIENQVLDITTKMNLERGNVTKDMLLQAEKMSEISNSERINTFLRLIRTQYYIKIGEFEKAKSYNEIFFIDIYNNQVREFLDIIYIHKFMILYKTEKLEELVILFDNKITQRRFLAIERKGKQLILPYILLDLAKCKLGVQTVDESYGNIYRILDYYHYSNFLSCYTTLQTAIEIVLEELKIDERQKLKLNQLSKIIEETINKV